MTITANEWVAIERTNAFRLFEKELLEFHRADIEKPRIKFTVRIEAPSGFGAFVTDRFSEWFIARNPEWKVLQDAKPIL